MPHDLNPSIPPKDVPPSVLFAMPYVFNGPFFWFHMRVYMNTPSRVLAMLHSVEPAV
jgi:hypothetical protein